MQFVHLIHEGALVGAHGVHPYPWMLREIGKYNDITNKTEVRKQYYPLIPSKSTKVGTHNIPAKFLIATSTGKGTFINF